MEVISLEPHGLLLNLKTLSFSIHSLWFTDVNLFYIYIDLSDFLLYNLYMQQPLFINNIFTEVMEESLQVFGVKV